MKENPIVQKDLVKFVEIAPFFENIQGCTFLVTGATGLIGSTLIKCLLYLNKVKDAKIKIIALARNMEKANQMFEDNDIEWFFQDAILPINIPCSQIDYVVHCANSTSSRFYVDYPVENINTAYIGTNNLLRFCKEKNVKGVVYLSSLECYGTITTDVPIMEHDMGYISPTDVRSSYSLGKRATECLCHCYAKEYGVPVRIARLTQTFSAGVSLQDNRVFAQFAKSIVNGSDIVLHTKGESTKPYCYTIDAVTAILFLLVKGTDGEAYNVANSSTYVSIRDMAQFLIDNFNRNCQLKIDIRDNMGYAPETKLNLSTDKLQALGWKPVYFLKDMYAQLINYYKTIL